MSSTDLRTRAVDGRPLDYLVTHEVVDWIEAHGLYRRLSGDGHRRAEPGRPRRRPAPRRHGPSAAVDDGVLALLAVVAGAAPVLRRA